MTGNTTHRFRNTAILAATSVDATEVVTSDALDERLGDTYTRVGLRPGLLERLVGIRERRWWADGVTFVDGAADRRRARRSPRAASTRPTIGLMVNTSVSRTLPRAVHRGRRARRASGCRPSCQNFDVTNACLGFVNGMEIAGRDDRRRPDRLRAGRRRRGRPRRCRRHASSGCCSPGSPAKDVMARVRHASPSGPAPPRWCSGRADRHPEGHRLVGSVSRAGTEHHELCIGDNTMMQHRPQGPARRRPGAVRRDLWTEAAQEFDWAARHGPLRHPPGLRRCTPQALCEKLGIDPARVPADLPRPRQHRAGRRCPFTLAGQAGTPEPTATGCC